MDITQLGKGAIPDPVDERDFQATDVMGAVSVDWSKEFRLPVPPDNDQGSSDSCVSQAWSYYQWQLRGKDYSRRDLFSRIALDYGAAIRTGGLAVINDGQATRANVPDPSPETPSNMRDKTGTSPSFWVDGKEYQSFVLPQQDLDGLAWGIAQYKGFVFGVNGSDQGWQDLTNPRPPMNGEALWGHALYAMGYHMHSDGQKCIIAKSSWCNQVKEHHIRAFYFQALNMTFNAWTLIPSLTLDSMKLVKDTKSQTVGIYTGNKDNRILAFSTIEALGLLGDEPQVPMDFTGIPIYNIVNPDPNHAGQFIIIKK